ncbi:unnamed protein product [Schistosoma curassoni]|uniref:Uncharacterized protein n=1 Tax=Schistosoma curassoni TaxID=6186 RepID=A0A3P7XZM4_9TREM|nr:unnamed protein product [Schistosoma curassoni]
MVKHTRTKLSIATELLTVILGFCYRKSKIVQIDRT